MKNYNDICDEMQKICAMIKEVYSKGYDKAYNDRKIEEEFDEDREKAIEEAYQKGLNDAWECVKKIFDMDGDTAKELFGDFLVDRISRRFTASEAIAKVKEYEQKQKADDEDDEIDVGDEVTNTGGFVAIVTCIHDEKYIDIMWDNGACNNFVLKKSVKKTGRHFDIENIFEQMKGNDNNDN